METRKSETLFPRIDAKAHMGEQKQEERKPKKKKGKKEKAVPVDTEGVITFEQFREIEIRVGLRATPW